MQLPYSTLSLVLLTLLPNIILAQTNATCGPFQLTSNYGGLYSAPNGTQYPGSDDPADNRPYTEYIVDDLGKLTNTNGSQCAFQPYFTCNVQAHEPISIFASYINSNGSLIYGGNETFYLCPRAALTNSVNSSNDDIFSDVIIFPPKQSVGHAGAFNDTGCRVLYLQASECRDFSVQDGTGGQQSGAWKVPVIGWTLVSSLVVIMSSVFGLVM